MNRLKLVFVMTLVIAGTSVQAQIVSLPNVRGQSRPVTLQLGVPLERTIGPRQIDLFYIELGENKYVQLVAEQRGVDVVVQVSSPAGKVLAEVDSPNGGDGPENVSFVAGAAGTYRIAVTPLDQDGVAAPGKYEIKIVEIRDATEDELKTDKNQEVVKARGLSLLDDIEQAITSLHSPSTRLRAQLKLAQMLWETDERRAVKNFADAISTFKEYLENSELRNRGNQLDVMRQLRNEILQAVMSRDPEMALTLLKSTRTYVTPDGPQQLGRDNEEAMMEISIANLMSSKDPKRALQIAETMLKKGYPGDLIGTVSNLNRTSPELGAKLASEINTKLLAEKLVTNYEAANLAASMLQVSRSSIAPPGPGIPGKILSESDYRALFQKLLSEALSYKALRMNGYTQERNAVWNALNAIKSLGAEADGVVPGSLAAVEKKLAELNSSVDPQYAQVQQFQNTVASGPLDAALEAVGQAPKEVREQLYQQLAERTAMNGDLARAKQIINDNVRDPYQRSNLINNLEEHAMYRAIQTGKIDDALRLISTRRTPRDRAALISQIANRIGPGQKRAVALKLLEQARSLLSPSEQAEDQEQMNALFELSRAFARYDQKRAFNIIEPLIDQFNSISAAARTMDGFGQEYFEDGELNLQNGNNVAGIANQLSSSLANLAVIDFDHAKATTDRLELPEVRVFVYLEIAQQTIQQLKTNATLFTQRRVLE
jgi:hypothetical protein